MINFQNVTVKRRLMLILVVWIIIFVGFGLFAISEMDNLENVTRDIYNDPLRVSNAAIEARVEIIEIHSDMKDLILSRNNNELTAEINQIKPLDESVINNLDIIKNNTTVDASRNLEEQIRQSFEEWQDGRNEVIDLVKKGDISQATSLTKDKHSILVNNLENLLVQVDNNSRKKADDLVKQSQDINNSQKIFLTLIIGVLSMLFFGIFGVIINSILRPINKLKGVMDNSINTGDLSEVSLNGSNEIVDMSRYYNILTRKLKEAFWIKDSKNELNQEIAGYITLEEFTQRTINFLCRTVSGEKGVFYIYNKEKSVLELKAGFAFNDKERQLSKLALGEGIIGQVALERKPMLLKDIKEEDETISSAIMNRVPASSYIFPITYEGELHGVIEIASLRALDRVKLDYLDEISSIIAINLYSAIQSERIRKLFKISEEAREETRKKAEELENANTILHQQQEILQQQAEELQKTNAELEEQQQLLQQQSEEMQQTNQQLEEQHQQLEEQTRLLNIQNNRLEESGKELELSNKYKSEFLANMSHELRTPLNSVILLSNILLDKGRDRLAAADQEKISVINRAGKELLRLINDVLDLSKIESGRMNIDSYVFHSSFIVNEVKDTFDTQAMEKNLDFVIEDRVNEGLFGDGHRIVQILRNFISNAIKFTEKGSVNVNITRDLNNEGGVVFTVGDTGIGIPENQVKSIFDEFQQGDGSISRKYGGTGLGLSISRKLAELMGGRIEVNSTVGVGSEFILYIPGLIMYDSEGGNENRGDFINAEDEVAAEKMDEAAVSEGSQRTILVIEDDKSIGEYIKNIIGKLGLRPILAGSGREGLKCAEKYRPQGILINLNLPDISGMDVLRELKSIKELSSIPVHIISEDNREDNAQKSVIIEESKIVGVISDIIDLSENERKKVLLVEDNRIEQEVISELIGGRNILVKSINTEEAARDELENEKYDLVILDLELKEGNGLNICKFMEANGMDTPVIINTCMVLTTEQEREIRKYADSIIIKTANSQKRLLDEVIMFLYKVKKDKEVNNGLFSKTNKKFNLSLEGKCILIVDDDPRNVFALASALEDYKADIIEAENGRSALEKLNEKKVDLVLMDIMMPEMDGYETIRKIREDDRLHNIPIIALTAKSLKGDKEKCIGVGANDYIPKPVNYDNLIRLVKAWITKE